MFLQFTLHFCTQQVTEDVGISVYAHITQALSPYFATKTHVCRLGLILLLNLQQWLG